MFDLIFCTYIVICILLTFHDKMYFVNCKFIISIIGFSRSLQTVVKDIRYEQIISNQISFMPNSKRSTYSVQSYTAIEVYPKPQRHPRHQWLSGTKMVDHSPDEDITFTSILDHCHHLNTYTKHHGYSFGFLQQIVINLAVPICFPPAHPSPKKLLTNSFDNDENTERNSRRSQSSFH